MIFGLPGQILPDALTGQAAKVVGGAVKASFGSMLAPAVDAAEAPAGLAGGKLKDAPATALRMATVAPSDGGVAGADAGGLPSEEIWTAQGFQASGAAEVLGAEGGQAVALKGAPVDEQPFLKQSFAGLPQESGVSVATNGTVSGAKPDGTTSVAPTATTGEVSSDPLLVSKTAPVTPLQHSGHTPVALPSNAIQGGERNASETPTPPAETAPSQTSAPTSVKPSDSGAILVSSAMANSAPASVKAEPAASTPVTQTVTAKAPANFTERSGPAFSTVTQSDGMNENVRAVLHPSEPPKTAANVIAPHAARAKAVQPSIAVQTPTTTPAPQPSGPSALPQPIATQPAAQASIENLKATRSAASNPATKSERAPVIFSSPMGNNASPKVQSLPAQGAQQVSAPSATLQQPPISSPQPVGTHSQTGAVAITPSGAPALNATPLAIEATAPTSSDMRAISAAGEANRQAEQIGQPPATSYRAISAQHAHQPAMSGTVSPQANANAASVTPLAETSAGQVETHQSPLPLHREPVGSTGFAQASAREMTFTPSVAQPLQPNGKVSAETITAPSQADRLPEHLPEMRAPVEALDRSAQAMPKLSNGAAPNDPAAARPLSEAVLAQIKSAQVEKDRTTVQLNPRGLGSIEIELVMEKDAASRVVLRVENPAVLNSLRDDRQILAQTLGLNQDTALEFTAGGETRPDDRSQSHLTDTRSDDGDMLGSEEPARPAHRDIVANGQLDIMT